MMPLICLHTHEGYVNTYVLTYAIDVDTSCTPEEGAHSPSGPNRLIIIIIIKMFPECSLNVP